MIHGVVPAKTVIDDHPTAIWCGSLTAVLGGAGSGVGHSVYDEHTAGCQKDPKGSMDFRPWNLIPYMLGLMLGVCCGEISWHHWRKRDCARQSRTHSNML